MFLPRVSVLLFLSGTSLGLPTKDGSGRLPALGWNSWNAYFCDVDEAKVLSAAHMLQGLGLQKAGYEYVNIDDCWSVKDHRDPETNRLLPNTTRFPKGISGLADELHGLGFKVGIYSDAGSQTCAGYPGSLYFEAIDAATWADWGIDYLKYDNCNVPSSWPSDQYHNCHPDYSHPSGPNATCVNDPMEAPPGYDWSTSNTARRYHLMRDALASQGRTILYSLCEWGQADVQTWGNETAQSWRTTDDIFSYWSRITHLLNYNSFLLNHADFWGHNDADMLEIGNGNLTDAESRSHFALWAAIKSPLLIGTDLAQLSATNVALLQNPYLLSFNQDPVVGAPATPYNWDWSYNDTYPADHWSGAYGDGRRLVLLVNFSPATAIKTARWGDVPATTAGASYKVLDVWTGKDLGCIYDSLQLEVESHDTAALVLGGMC